MPTPAAYNDTRGGNTVAAIDKRAVRAVQANAEVARDNGYKQNRDWLCPSQEVNRKLELDTMLEMVKKYDVDGVHFDYMRYGWEQM